jgi:hypothetical protein
VRLAQFLIEVKRRKSIAVYEWLEQCQRACKPTDKPVVIARGDHKGFVVIQPLEDWLEMAKRELPER